MKIPELSPVLVWLNQLLEHLSLRKRDASGKDALRIQKLAELLTEARDMLLGFRQPSPSSTATYERIYAGIRSGKALNEYATHSDTYYQARAAYVFGCCRDLAVALLRLKHAFATGDRNAGKLVPLIKELLEDLRKIPPDRERQRCTMEDYFGEYRQLAGDRRDPRPKSKRRGLPSLPANWESELVSAAVKAQSRYLLPIAILVATGCRPAEVAKGVGVTVADDGTLRFRIIGAKVIPGKQGQDWREVRVADDSLAVQVLKRAIAATTQPGQAMVNVSMTVTARTAKGLGQAVAHFGRQLSTKSHHISPYSLRHQLNSDLKRSGVKPNARAAILGHQTDRTGQGYGASGSGRGPRQITATAARPVRSTRQDPANLSSKKLAPKPKRRR